MLIANYFKLTWILKANSKHDEREKLSLAFYEFSLFSVMLFIALSFGCVAM